MVIRRIREHVAELNWVAIAVDLAIVVLGVFLGTQVSNWNSDRIDRHRGAEYRRRLIADLATTEQVMAGLEHYAAQVNVHSEGAMAVIDDRRQPAGAPFLVDAYQASQALVYSSHHVTYDEIVGAGGLELVGSPDLRERISNYYWRMDRLLGLDSGSPPFREMLRTAMPNVAQEAIRDRCDEQRRDLGNYLIVPTLPETCAIALDPADTVRAAARVRGWPGIGDTLNRQMSSNDYRMLSYRLLRKGALQTRLAIEAFDR